MCLSIIWLSELQIANIWSGMVNAVFTPWVCFCIVMGDLYKFLLWYPISLQPLYIILLLFSTLNRCQLIRSMKMTSCIYQFFTSPPISVLCHYLFLIKDPFSLLIHQSPMVSQVLTLSFSYTFHGVLISHSIVVNDVSGKGFFSPCMIYTNE